MNEQKMRDAVERAFDAVIVQEGSHQLIRDALFYVKAQVLNALHNQGVKVNSVKPTPPEDSDTEDYQ